MLARSMSLSSPPGNQRYRDVLPSHENFHEIQRLSNKGVISGFPCGGPGEPCGSDGRMYFRPNTELTRGAVSKFVSLSLPALAAPSPGNPIFADVPANHTFFQYIQHLATINVISGYVCGSSSAEPCDSEKRPYFRPNAYMNRGQAAKVVATAFPTYTCPETEYVDCMPGVGTGEAYCEQAFLDWAEANCPNFKGAVY